VRPLLTFTTDYLHIVPWSDEVIDHLGLDPRSAYVEQFWLGILGPSTTWLVRRLADGLEVSADGYYLPLAETARALGLGDRNGRHSPFLRAINRTIQFELAQATADDELAVRRRIPPLNRRQLSRLSPALQASHQDWQDRQLRVPNGEQQWRRARQLALSLLELGEDGDAAERQLLRWRYQPSQARNAVNWAAAQRRGALCEAPAPAQALHEEWATGA
jgi:hypothetical protein